MVSFGWNRFWFGRTDRSRQEPERSERKSKDFIIETVLPKELAIGQLVVEEIGAWHKPPSYNDSQFVEPIGENLEHVRSQIADAAKRSGRTPDEIRARRKSRKSTDADRVRAAHEAGQTLFGESRVQERAKKFRSCLRSLRWHFVGHLQKNKIRHALPLFELFHGIDSLDLARDLNRVAEERGNASADFARSKRRGRGE